MISLLGRLLRLFPESVPLEDLFTEAVARLFSKRPELCLAWLEDAGLLSYGTVRACEGRVRISSQRRLRSLEHHEMASRIDLLIEVHWPSSEEPTDGEAVANVVMVESKIGSGEGQDQLRRYAEHLDGMAGFDGKALLYVTRAYDPKDRDKILAGLDGNVLFEQLRWHDFYRFLQGVKKDALVEEVMAFMEEQGMASNYRFSTTDLATLSGIPRAFEIMEETLGGEVKAELEAFAGSKSNHETINAMLKSSVRYVIQAPVRSSNLFCYLGYRLRTSEGYPLAYVTLHLQSGAVGKEVPIAALKRIARRDGWESHGLEEPKPWARVVRTISLANVLREEDHVAALQRFFVESIRQLGEELTAFKKEHSDLPWAGE